MIHVELKIASPREEHGAVLLKEISILNATCFKGVVQEKN